MSVTAGSLEGHSAVYEAVLARDRVLSGNAQLKLTELASTRLAAEILETSRARVRRLCAAGALPVVRVEGRWYLYRPAVEHYSRSITNPGTAAFEAVIVQDVFRRDGRRIVLLDVTSEDEQTVRGRWVSVEGETLGYEAIEKAEIEARVPMVMRTIRNYRALERADRARR